jgi:uncharacterized protein involved in response to NO
MLIQINKPNDAELNKFALFNLGFRPFFLGAGIFAVISIALWMFIYLSHLAVNIENITISQWHAHEMLYGYGLAVVAGFLLTAVKNWTGVQTPHGKPLMVLFASWCVARILLLFGTAFLAWAATADLLFGLFLIVAITQPIVKAKQWKQLAVVSKVLLLWVGNLVFYLGCYGIIKSGMLYAINGAVLLFVSLILMIGRRVIPFFIERGVDVKQNEARVQLKQYQWLDSSILVVFIALFLNAIFAQIPYLTLVFAWALFALNGYRLLNWHAAGIWHVPLLWSLYVSAWLINIGFFCYGLQTQYSGLSILTLHIFTIGGIGLMTLGMMSRVALGHTGRDIRQPSRWVGKAFAAIVISVVFRALVPMFTMQYYPSWVMIAATFWIIGFATFVVIYMPILLKVRIDGAYG